MRTLLTDRQRHWLGVAVIIAVTLVVYLPALRAGFIWDDDKLVTNNPVVHAADGWWRVWQPSATQFYFPVTWLSFWLEWQLWGPHAAGYHLSNVLLHTLGAVLVWRVLVRLRVPAAWLAGLLFAVHPVAVESVAWIAERKNTLSLIFAAATTLVYLRFERTGHRRDYGWALALYVLALLSKSTVVMLPVVFWLFAWWQRHRLSWPDVRRTLPFLVLAAVAGFASLWSQHHLPNTEGWGHDHLKPGPQSGFIAAGWTIGFYLVHAIWPANLMTFYPFPTVAPGSLLRFVPTLVVVGLVTTLAWHRARPRIRPLWTALAYYLIMLFPIWGIALVFVWKKPALADHLQYYSLAGITALVAPLVARSRPAAVALVVVLGALSWRECRKYHDPETLWRAALAANPTAPMAHYNLGTLLLERRDFAEARVHLETVARLRSRHVLARLNLGTLHAACRDYATAADYFRQAIALKPRWPNLHDNLGNVHVLQGQLEPARAAFAEAVQLAPTARRHYALGSVLLQQGDTAAARVALAAATRLDPAHVEAQLSLGNLHARAGDFSAATAAFTAAVTARPDSATARYNLGLALLQQHQLSTALPHLREAARLNPQDPATRQLLADVERLQQ